MRDWMDVAILAKTRNLKGRLVVQNTAGLSFLLQEGITVAFVPPKTDLPRMATVAYARVMDEFSAEVEFEGVDGDTAYGLVGCHCLIRRSDIEESAFEDEPALWEDWQVFDDEAGFLGEVSGIVENPGQALLEVSRADGRGDLLVPVVDEIVRGVDARSRAVHVVLPHGLLELNATDGA